MNRIALVEDHERIAALICTALAGAGIEVDVYGRADHAWSALQRYPYAALVIDRGLPDGDGLDLLRRLRGGGLATPCLILTAQDALHDRVDGLDAGADDYLPKPFSMLELVARVRALLRRPALQQEPVPRFGDIELRPEAASLHCGSAEVALASAELQILLCLIRAAGTAVRRGALEHAAWGLGTAVTPNAMDVALHRLRKKLQSIKSRVAVVNLRGYGYILR